ncbi:MAG: prepilin peptidase [Gammaproteobacteria bacterium]
MPVIADLHSNPALFIAIMACLGLMMGSFHNVVIHRLPIMMERDWREQCRELMGLENAPNASGARYDLVFPRSQCPHCGHRIGVLENIPLLSYAALGGKCRACRAKISLRYPLVELLSAFLAGVVAWRFGFAWQAAGAALLSWALIGLSAIDFDQRLLPDAITLPVLWLGLLLNLLGVYTDLQSAVVGAMAGYLSLWSVYMLFKLFTGKEGMGHGDFKLLAMLGAWMGWQVLPLVVVLSSVVGAVVGTVWIVFRVRERTAPIPFGPYLAAAGWIALLWGEWVTQTYLQWAAGA